MTLEFSRVPLPPLLTLDQAKMHLHLTGTTYDADVQEILDAAQDAIVAYLGVAADPTWTAATAPKAVTHAIKLLLGYYYADRGDDDVKDPWPKLYALLAAYRDPTVVA